MDTLGEGQAGLAHGNIKRPFKNEFWRNYERFQQLQAKLDTLEASLTQIDNDLIAFRSAFNAYNNTWQSQNSGVLGTGAGSLYYRLGQIITLLTTISGQLDGTSAFGQTLSAGQWLAFVRDCLTNSTATTIDTVYKTLIRMESDLTDIEANTDYGTSTVKTQKVTVVP